MDDWGRPAALTFDLARQSPFSFKCQVCGACCYGKTIRVSPYEALRLSRYLGLTTPEFQAKYTEQGGTVLRVKPDGSCVFLGPKGCIVHPDRPLVCRLYPLGQIVNKEGKERFGLMPPHPDCLGVYGVDGTVEGYLKSQGAEVYFHFDRIYAQLSRPMGAQLDRIGKKLKMKKFAGAIEDWLTRTFSQKPRRQDSRKRGTSRP